VRNGKVGMAKRISRNKETSSSPLTVLNLFLCSPLPQPPHTDSSDRSNALYLERIFQQIPRL
jgi:hypothetical protein